MKYLFSVYWKEYRIGFLLYKKPNYIFMYDQLGLKKSSIDGFDTLIGFPNIDKIYISNKIFSVFSSRIKSELRLERDNESQNKKDCIEKLIEDKGELLTDNIQIIKERDININGKKYF